MSRPTREELGRLVREVWIEWAKEQPAPKASWLVEWDGLSEPDKEVDRRIGERLYDKAVLALPDLRSCTICGLTVDVSKGHAAPSCDFTTRGRGARPGIKTAKEDTNVAGGKPRPVGPLLKESTAS